MVALLSLLGAYYLVARPFGALVGALVDFMLKRHWAFDRARKRGVTSETLRYVTVSAMSLVWTTLLCMLLVEVGRISVGTAVLASSIAVGVTWNYPLHRLFVFASP